MIDQRLCFGVFALYALYKTGDLQRLNDERLRRENHEANIRYFEKLSRIEDPGINVPRSKLIIMTRS
jgi:hypothetical protein